MWKANWETIRLWLYCSDSGSSDSRTAKVDSGKVIEPKAIVNANSHISTGCIISVGAIVDHDVEIGDCCHINAGANVKAGGKVERYRKLEAGEVVLAIHNKEEIKCLKGKID